MSSILTSGEALTVMTEFITTRGLPIRNLDLSPGSQTSRRIDRVTRTASLPVYPKVHVWVPSTELLLGVWAEALDAAEVTVERRRGLDTTFRLNVDHLGVTWKPWARGSRPCSVSDRVRWVDSRRAYPKWGYADLADARAIAARIEAELAACPA
jgi:hypothetical protein